MRKLISLLGASLLVSTTAMAQTYLNVGAGLGFPNSSSATVNGSVTLNDAISLKSGVFGQIGVGTDYDDKFRIEGSVARQGYSVDKVLGTSVAGSTEDVTSYMVNGYYDFKPSNPSSLTPYVMFGVGTSSVTSKSSGSETSQNSTTYQIGAGVSMKNSDKITFDAGLRYMSIPNLSERDSSSNLIEWKSSAILASVGVRVHI